MRESGASGQDGGQAGAQRRAERRISGAELGWVRGYIHAVTWRREQGQLLCFDLSKLVEVGAPLLRRDV